MSSSNSKHLLLSGVLAVFVVVGCQNAKDRTVVAQTAKGGQTPPAQEQADKKLDDILKADASIECTADMIRRHEFIQTDVKRTNQKVADNKGKKLDPIVEKDLVDTSVKMKTKGDILTGILVKENAAGCKLDDVEIKILKFKSAVNDSIIAVATLTGKETAVSKAARDEKAKYDQKPDAKPEEPAGVGQKLKISKKLASLLDEKNAEQDLHFFNGQQELTIKNYKKNLKNEELTVCLLIQGAETKLKENDVLTVMALIPSEKEEPSKDDADNVVITKKLAVTMTVNSEFINLECRIGASAKTELAEVKKALGALIK